MPVGTWHIITCEYPPSIGGVADYTQVIAAGLGAAGDDVHVWCRAIDESEVALGAPGVTVHRELGNFRWVDLRRVGRLLNRFRAPRRLLLQWVPHGYGWRSMNLLLCAWLWYRAATGDVVEIMVHEPFLAFRQRSLLGTVAAAVHRVMAIFLLAAARRVWVSTPEWGPRLRPYALGKRLRFQWLPVPSTVPVIVAPEDVHQPRVKMGPRTQLIIGHFGSFDRHTESIFKPLVPVILEAEPRAVLLLIGSGSTSWRDRLIIEYPHFSNRITATGALASHQLSSHIAACDVMLQPYPGGINSRRTSVMAALSHGKAVVSNAGHLTEPFWVETGAVSLAAEGDSQALTTKILDLLDQVERRAALGKAAATLYKVMFAKVHTVTALRTGAVDDTPRGHDGCAVITPCG